MRGSPGWARRTGALALPSWCTRLQPVIIGENPHNIGKLYELMIRCLSGEGSLAGATVTAISGIEIALWDLVGRALNTPIYNLFGGRFRDRVRVYADCHAGATPDPADYAERARQVVAAGFTAIKFDLDTPQSLHRRHLGRSPPAAAVVRAVQPHHQHGRAALDGFGGRSGARGGGTGHPGGHGLPLEVRRQRRARNWPGNWNRTICSGWRIRCPRRTSTPRPR